MNKLLIDGFLESLKMYPQQSALHVDSISYTYQELAFQAARISKTLNTASNYVGVFAHRSLAAYSSVLGILAAGRAYMPFNPKFPSIRLTVMREDSDCDTVILASEGLEAFHDWLLSNPAKLNVITFDLETDEIEKIRKIDGVKVVPIEASDEKTTVLTRPDSPGSSIAYLLFTSGSTGKPKGVPVSNENVASYMMSAAKYFTADQDARYSQMFDLSFDLSVHDMFVCWGAGGCLYSVPEASVRTPAEFIEKMSLTHWFSVPSLAWYLSQIGMLKPDRFPSLRSSLFCGEPLPQDVAKKWALAAPNSRIVNTYGPTEATIAISFYEWDRSSSEGEAVNGIVPIGTLFEGQECAVVDKSNKEVKKGQLGELCLAGSQVTGGYLNNDEKTKAAFVQLKGESDKTWYRTGDLVALSEAGILAFHGRVDSQVKIHGHRIELQEVEHALSKASGVDLAVCIPWPWRDGLPQGLLGFLPLSEKSNRNTILEKCTELLPPYMVPQQLDFLETFPKNPNGKIDRKKLGEMKASEPLQNLERKIYGACPSLNPETSAAFYKKESGKKQVVVIAELTSSLTANLDSDSPVVIHRVLDQMRKAIRRKIETKADHLLSEVNFISAGTLPEEEDSWARRAKYEELHRRRKLSHFRDEFGLVPGASYSLSSSVSLAQSDGKGITLETEESSVSISKSELLIFRYLLLGGAKEAENTDLGSGVKFAEEPIQRVNEQLKTDPSSISIMDPYSLFELFFRKNSEAREVFTLYGKLVQSGVLRESIKSAPGQSGENRAITILLRPQSKQLYMVYTGAALVDVLQMPPSAFLRETQLISRNIMIFRDRTLSGYMNGVSASLPTFEAMLGYQKAVIESHPELSQCFSLGTSMGAFAAILSAYFLGFESAWAFGLLHTKAGQHDLKKLLKKSNGVTTYHLYYNEGAKADKATANQLKGFPGVKLFPIPGKDHFVVQELWRRKMLGNIFPKEDLPKERFSNAKGTIPNITQNDIFDIISKITGVSQEELRPDFNLKGLLTSFATIELFTEIEERLGVHFRGTEIEDEAFETPGNFFDWLHAQVGKMSERKPATSSKRQPPIKHETHTVTVQPRSGERELETTPKSMKLTNNLASFKEGFLELERVVVDPLNKFVYDNAEQSLQIQKKLFQKHLGEFSPPYGWILLSNNNIAAMFSGMSSNDYYRRRRRTALEMMDFDEFNNNPGIQERLQLANSVLVKPKEGDFYFSRLAISPKFQKMGLGRFLVQHVEEKAKRMGHKRVVAEINTENQGSLRLFLGMGFVKGPLEQIECSKTGKILAYQHISKSLS